jgi:hypothetical protein
LQSTQWIAWDAGAKQIRSWSFQADGGFAESTWTKEGKKWVVKSDSVLADGDKVTSTDFIVSGEKGTLSVSSTDQKVNGQALPDTKELRMKRLR